MRAGIAAAVLLLVTAAPCVAAARAPMTLVLATAHGPGSVTIGAGTAHLHGRIWLVRRGGSGTARGTVTVSLKGKGLLTVTLRGY